MYNSIYIYIPGAFIIPQDIWVLSLSGGWNLSGLQRSVRALIKQLSAAGVPNETAKHSAFPSLRAAWFSQAVRMGVCSALLIINK